MFVKILGLLGQQNKIQFIFIGEIFVIFDQYVALGPIV
jgi:hypothetical protein